jgi:hypothetical protein
MPEKLPKIKPFITRLFLVTGDHMHSFPVDRQSSVQAQSFLQDCESLGWPSLQVDDRMYVYATRRVGR